MKFSFLAAPVLAASSSIFGDDDPTCIATEFEQDTSYHMGAQYDIGHVPATDAGDCCAKCRSKDGCKAFTLADGECWLHKAAGNRQHKAGIISGSVAHITTTTTTPAPPTPPTPPPTPLAPPTPAPPVTSPVQVYIMLGQSNMLGEGHIEGWTDETLEHAAVMEGLYPYLIDQKTGSWAQVDHVRDVAVMGSGGPDGTVGAVHHNEWLSVNPTKKNTFGPELGIGFTLANHTDKPTMLLKSCIGNRALGWDLLPPGTKEWEYDYGNGKVSVFAGYGESPAKWDKGSEKPAPATWYAGLQYDGDVNRSKLVLEDLATYYPGGATDYEVAGFFWWQGDKDMRDPGYYTRYEYNLVNLIKQLRKEYNAPNAKFVTASLGQTEKGSTSGDGQILDAMLAVDGKSGKYPEFASNVAAVYTHPYSKGSSSSAHYGGNAQTYMNIGQAMGAAMVELMKSDSVQFV